jgi:hypothetical protein
MAARGTYDTVKLMVHLHRCHIPTATLVTGRDSHISFGQTCSESFIFGKREDTRW